MNHPLISEEQHRQLLDQATADLRHVRLMMSALRTEYGDIQAGIEMIRFIHNMVPGRADSLIIAALLEQA